MSRIAAYINDTKKVYNAITRMIYAPCDDPPSVWIEAAIPAVLEMIYTIVEPDFKEAYHQIVGKSLVCSMKQAVMDAHEADSSVPDSLRRGVFKLAEMADMAVWYAFLASVGEQALLNWTSQVFKFSKCNGQRAGHIKGPWLQSAISNDVWTGTECQISDGSGGTIYGSTGITVKPGHSGIVAVHGSAQTLDHNPLGLSARIIVSPTNEILDTDESTWVEGEGTTQTICFAHYQNNANVVHSVSWQGYVHNDLWPHYAIMPDIGGYLQAF